MWPLQQILHTINTFENSQEYLSWKREKCDRCQKLISSKQGLQYHIESVHNKNRRVECDLCDKVYTYKPTLTRHKKDVHNVKWMTEPIV